jgi:hypothetical protein
LKQRYAVTKNKVFTAYGKKCVCCGETTIECLQIDHINGGGRKHKLSLKINFYAWLVKNKFPSGFQTLCANCNFAKARHGCCPHQSPVIPKRIKEKTDCFEAYGGAKCNSCGENKIAFLEIDHIDNNGGVLRKIDSRQVNIYRWLRLNNYPNGYQVLCSNCNWKKKILLISNHGSKLPN